MIDIFVKIDIIVKDGFRKSRQADSPDIRKPAACLRHSQ
jgi:hypothetical protein